MSTEVETTEATAQPLQAMAKSSIIPEGHIPRESHEDQSQTIDIQAKPKESPEEKSSKQALSAKARKRTKTGCLSKLS